MTELAKSFEPAALEAHWGPTWESAGLYAPTEGRIEFRGQRLQMIFQDPYASLNPRWRVRSIIAEPMQFLNERKPVENFLLQVGLSADDAERYSAQDTVAAQGNLFLREGTVLRSNEGRPMMTIAATSVEYHDTIGGACSCESNTLRYGHHTKSQHACVENFLEANLSEGRGKRDIVSNINFFMNVPVESDGALGIVDGISAPGLAVDLRAEMDVIVVVSNCPQINNPCNAFNPTPVRMIVTA